MNFGAFVDLGGVDGLVHVSELSWKHVDHPSEVVTVGQEVEVEVLDVDLDRERVSLSLKATQEDRGGNSPEPTRSARLSPAGSRSSCRSGRSSASTRASRPGPYLELAGRHVEIPEQVVQVDDEIFVV